MEIKIDTLKENEIYSVKDILLEMWLAHSESDLISKENLQSMSVVDYAKETIKDPNQIFLIAKFNNEIIGIVRCEIQKTLSFYKEPYQAYIDDLVVIKKYRGEGIAEKLINSCVEWAKNKKANLLTCKIWNFNKESEKFFKRIGFKKDFSFYSLKI